jgi:hypothetical protein
MENWVCGSDEERSGRLLRNARRTVGLHIPQLAAVLALSMTCVYFRAADRGGIMAANDAMTSRHIRDDAPLKQSSPLAIFNR